MPYWYVRTKANYFNGIKHNRCEYFRDLNYTDTQVHVLPDFINKCKKSAVCFFIAAQFLPRDAMQARPILSYGVCLSVRPSVTFVHSVKTNKHIFKILHRQIAAPFLVFHTKRRGNIPTGTLQKGASNAGGVGRNHDFEPISGFNACCQR